MTAATTQTTDMNATFGLLKPLLRVYQDEMILVHDTTETYYLNTKTIMENGSPLFFGSVSIKKNYVSFHLFPLYVYPELLEGIGDLKKRMQGKTCFNFRRIDDAQLGLLDALVRTGYERFRSEGLLRATSGS